jgi:hypothetical protein
MRKRYLDSNPQTSSIPDQDWLNLDAAAIVEVSSEADGHPIESALVGHNNSGWRAATSGTQTIRLIFDRPERIKRIHLIFEDSENTRTQEFVLRSSLDRGNSFQEIVRQQWNFSPPHSTREIEDYPVDLHEVTQLELIVTPDKSGGHARASLISFRLG